MLLLGLGAGWLYERALRLQTRKGPVLAGGGALLILLAAMSAITIRQTGYWRNSETLWSREAGVFPEEAFAYYQLGHAAIDRGDIPSALGYFEQALRLRPMNVEYVLSRGVAYFFLGDYLKALSDLEMALMLDPDHPKARSYMEMSQRALERQSASGQALER